MKISFLCGDDINIDSAIIFGAGNYGNIIISLLMRQKVKVAACFDNDINKVHTRCYGDVRVTLPYPTRIPVIICIRNQTIGSLIEKQLMELGGGNPIFRVDFEQADSEFLKLDDKEYLNVRYFNAFHKNINWKTPRGFNEKIQWLKLNDHNPDYHIWVDKEMAKEYVGKKIGEEYIVPTIGIYENVELIPFDELPDKYVIKCTHDSGSTRIVERKNAGYQGMEEIKKDIDKKLKTDFYILGREWAYKGVKPRIIIEELLENSDGHEIIDYKFMCFNGKVKCSFVCTNRRDSTGLKVTFFDLDWKVMPFERHYHKSKELIKKPNSYALMVNLAEKISENIPFARIDFYEVNGQPYFGEITLYPGCGFEEFNPPEWDEKLGDWLDLTNVR